MIRKIELNNEVRLKIKERETVHNDELEIEFISVKEDSRCPKGANCFWAGNGKIEIEAAEKNGEPAIFELNTELEPKSVRCGQFDIELTALEPYPQIEREIKEKNYSVILTISKN